MTDGFRELTRHKQKLAESECIELLKSTQRGVLSVLGDNGYPYGSPINHFYDEESGKIWFHGGKAGHKVDAMRNCDKVSFCVMDDGRHVGDDWFLTFRSVIVFGRMELIDDWDTIAGISRKLSYKFTSDDAYIDEEIRKSGPGTLMYALNIENMCGKLVRER